MPIVWRAEQAVDHGGAGGVSLNPPRLRLDLAIGRSTSQCACLRLALLMLLPERPTEKGCSGIPELGGCVGRYDTLAYPRRSDILGARTGAIFVVIN